MAKKTPGKLNSPPDQVQFNLLPLAKWCAPIRGIFYRLHGIDRSTGNPWPPVYFSRAGHSRFDHPAGPGTLCIGESLAGVLLEGFDDSWGPVGHFTRSLTAPQLQEWWVSLVAVPAVTVFEADKTNLSKIGTDFQLLAGDHLTSREWSLRLARHPAKAEGILYPSRHDRTRHNLALFRQARFLPERLDPRLSPTASYAPTIDDTGPIVYGPPLLLREHPELQSALAELEVGVLP